MTPEPLIISIRMRGKLTAMRAVAMLTVVVAGFATLPAASGAAASHRTEKAVYSALAPSWSPDGKQIAFAYVRYDASLVAKSYRIIRTSSRPGGAMHTVLASKGFCCQQMQWAAGGRILVNPTLGLKSVGALGEKSKRLFFPTCAGPPDPNYGCSTVGFLLSPNREYAAAAVTADAGDPHVDWGIGLVKVEPDGTSTVLSTPLGAEEQSSQIYDHAIAFSPDGSQLVFSRTSWDGWSGGPTAPLMAIPVEGGGDAVPLAQSGIPGAAVLPGDFQQVQWSPDGRWIAYVEGESLKVISTAGGPPTVLPSSCGEGSLQWDVSWSSTSDSIAYGCFGFDGAKPAGSRWTITLMTASPDGTHSMNVLEDRPLVFAGAPQWSPDGSRLLFLGHKVGYRAVHVWTIRADGSHLTRID
jgi:WD40 repeat protein